MNKYRNKKITIDGITFDSIKDIGKLGGIHIGALSPLFPRLKKDEEIKFLTDLIDGK